MKTKLSLTVTSAMLLLLNACGVATVTGSGKIVNESRDVQSYSQIVFSAPGELHIEQNGGEGLVIEADDNLLRYIKTSVKGDVLYISVEPEVVHLFPSRPIRYSLYVEMLSNVTLNGSGDIRSNELIASNLEFDLNGSGNILVTTLKSETVTLNLDGSGKCWIDSLMARQLTTALNGSGDIIMQEALVKTVAIEIDDSGTLQVTDIIADTLNLRLNGSGDSTLTGKVNHQTIAIHGSGGYQARDLLSQVTDVKISGSGNGYVWATDELRISIAGSGGVTYRGQPAIKETITGSGNLTSMARQWFKNQ